MIKNYWEITLRDYDVMEKTGNVSQFKKSWNILPTALFNKRIRELRKILIEKLNNRSTSSEDQQREREIWKTESYLNIAAIEVNYAGLVAAIKKTESNELKKYFQKFTRKRLKIRSNTRFHYYANELKKYTGIEIKKAEDIERIANQLEFKKDKYNENFKPKETDNNKRIYLMGFAMGVFARLGMAFSPEIKVIEFIEAKDRALSINTKKEQ